MTTASGHVSGARSLPDDYAGLGVPSSDGVLKLVARRWGDRSEGDRRNLAQILIMVLEPLNEPGARVTEDLRSTCEQVVADWIEKTTPVGERPGTGAPPAPERSRRVRLITTEVTEGNGSAEWTIRVTLQVGARRYVGIEKGQSDPFSQLMASARATLEALRQLVPGAPYLEVKKIETFEAFESMGVIVALRVTEADQQDTLVGVCPRAQDLVRAAAISVLNATNRRLGTG